MTWRHRSEDGLETVRRSARFRLDRRGRDGKVTHRAGSTRRALCMRSRLHTEPSAHQAACTRSSLQTGRSAKWAVCTRVRLQAEPGGREEPFPSRGEDEIEWPHVRSSGARTCRNGSGSGAGKTATGGSAVGECPPGLGTAARCVRRCSTATLEATVGRAHPCLGIDEAGDEIRTRSWSGRKSSGGTPGRCSDRSSLPGRSGSHSGWAFPTLSRGRLKAQGGRAEITGRWPGRRDLHSACGECV